MPSPFPGVDPFIEGQRWHGFHSNFITGIQSALVPQVRPRYAVDIEEFVFIAPDDDEEEYERRIGPDVNIAKAGAVAETENDDEQDPAPPIGPAAADASVVTLPRPVVRTIPLPRRRRQRYLVIRNRDLERIVTAIELLSPKNKTRGDGQNQYLLKRQNVLHADANLIELDLLRGGLRLPTIQPLPAGDYYAFVCRRARPSKAAVYAWTLRDRLPSIPVPLGDDEPEAVIDLRSVFTAVYDNAGYDYALKYARDVVPPLPEADADWVREIVASRLPVPTARQ